MAPIRTTLAGLLMLLSAAAGAGCDDEGGGRPAAQVAVPNDAGAAGTEVPVVQPARYLVGHADGVHDVGFSPDGKKIVTAGHDATVRVWDAPTAKQLLLLE